MVLTSDSEDREEKGEEEYEALEESEDNEDAFDDKDESEWKRRSSLSWQLMCRGHVASSPSGKD